MNSSKLSKGKKLFILITVALLMVFFFAPFDFTIFAIGALTGQLSSILLYWVEYDD